MKLKFSYSTLALLKNWLKGFIPTWSKGKKPEDLACAWVVFKLSIRLASRVEIMHKEKISISFSAAECAVIYKAWMESPYTMGQAPTELRDLIEQIDKTYFA